jgi:hypothetical protein
MTALGIDTTDRETTQDWTGLTSGHQRPAKVQAAYDAMIEAWANYNFACDVRLYTPMQLDELREAARNADMDYSQVYALWQYSLQPCECQPGRPNEDERTCPSCRARHELNGDGEMPF